MPSDETPSLLALEYEQLKEEQRLRIGTRDNLVYATIGALALIVGAVIQSGSTVFLLLAPPVCVTLGWTYLANDDRITAIGVYVGNVLGPELSRLSSAETELFAWERRHRESGGRPLRKACQLLVDLLLFCGTAVVALVTAWCDSAIPPPLHLAIAVELAVIAALAARFVTLVR
ncbi:hypothetical protein HUT06_21555 [Actinomadura sp. NAK00032]|uniref:hypothetical protein n=1 Tax=Actinomadura sp. NAK00032 TaxID=2742128 RepID=UPI0015916043|nr:hypothetical protein [Actinomadura sp. NAK00032]QKW36298.1 hypothetical protein HUT06_21555 [Actinomadura sp. NAK00032]